METRRDASVSPDLARGGLELAREARTRSARRASGPASLILSLSLLSGAVTLNAAHRGPGAVVSIIAIAWFVLELLRLSAAQHWEGLRFWPRARWSPAETILIAAAVAVGGLVGPHLLAHADNAPAMSWGLAGAVTVTVAGLLFGARASFRSRMARASRR